MAKKKWLHKILAILPSISLIVILLISSFEIGAYGDWNFYEKEYEKYKVADELYMEMPDIMKVTKFMMSYLRGNEKKLSIETEVEGNIQDFFNEKDRLHMSDVQGAFSWRTCNPEGSDPCTAFFNGGTCADESRLAEADPADVSAGACGISGTYRGGRISVLKRL